MRLREMRSRRAARRRSWRPAARRAATDKGGGSGGVRTLALASPESPGRPGSLDVEYFAEQVESLSDGRLRVEVDVGRRLRTNRPGTR